jgi:predicted tellurium resistance membrane protein TerC
VGGRLLLLLGISWLVKLTEPLLSVAQWTLSGKDLVMLLGGAFLIYKSTHEIYDKVERGAEGGQHHASTRQATLASVLVQIMLIDVVFSLDSIITAVGLVNHIGIMVMAILISLGLMIAAANHIGDFIDRHPSIKILALSFLLMIGTMLVAEAFHVHIPKGYIYASLVFALIVEFINIRANTRKPHTV